jgi:jouberin
MLQCYSLYDRLLSTLSSSLFKQSQEQYIADVTAHQYHLSDFEQHQLANKIVSLEVVKTSNLELDSNILHPWVKVHVVNIKTGKYVNKSSMGIMLIVFFLIWRK